MMMALLRFICLLFVVSGVSSLSTPPEKIVVTAVTACKMESKTTFKVNGATLDMDFDLPGAFDDKLQANVEIEAGGAGKWKSVLKSNGAACKLTTQYMSPLLKKVSKSFDPVLPTKCPWRKGMYQVKGLDSTFSRSDFNVPSLAPGLYKATVSVKNDKGKVVFCAVTEATVKSV